MFVKFLIWAFKSQTLLASSYQTNYNSNLWSNLHFAIFALDTSTMSLSITTCCGCGSSDANSTSIRKYGGQTKWGPCGRAIWIVRCMLGVL